TRLVDAAPDRFDNEIRALLQDSDGKIWITNKRGEVYFHKDGDVKVFTKKQVPGSIYCITEDRHKNIWMGTKGYGLIKLEPENEQRTKYKIVRYEHDPEDLTSLSSNQIYNITEDYKGRLWICTFQKGPNLNQVPGSIYCITEDRHKNIWMGTKGYGLIKLEPENEQRTKYKIVRYEHDPEDLTSLSSNQVYNITEDYKGRLWICTFQKGPN